MNTARLELRLQSPAEVLAWVESLPAAEQVDVSPEWLKKVKLATEPDPWLCQFQIVRAADGVVLGSCGFSGAPDAAGMVEIAYAIAEEFRGQGYATEAAEGLVMFAKSQLTVSVVRAHTKADNPASGAVLKKAGFVFVGDFVDPEDGEVRRWEKI
ncbi:MAG: GNAT family N-acetyltransferase [Calditrichaeota bacterium]|nr:GNAT family N-acetyltransferase [Calditrichota bacterium]MCB9368335.1 GNAT family N-acetyltransferase [Calditrichota bacterium]